jgi:hypothetical protein
MITADLLRGNVEIPLKFAEGLASVLGIVDVCDLTTIDLQMPPRQGATSMTSLSCPNRRKKFLQSGTFPHR